MYETILVDFGDSGRQPYVFCSNEETLDSAEHDLVESIRNGDEWSVSHRKDRTFGHTYVTRICSKFGKLGWQVASYVEDPFSWPSVIIFQKRVREEEV